MGVEVQDAPFHEGGTTTHRSARYAAPSELPQITPISAYRRLCAHWGEELLTQRDLFKHCRAVRARVGIELNVKERRYRAMLEVQAGVPVTEVTERFSVSCRHHENVMDMTGFDPLAGSRAPTMAAAFPEVTTRIVEILRETGYPELAGPLPAQRFYGRCHCRPGCSFVLTAPPGSSSSLMVWLEVSGETVGEASLDPAGQIITDFDICNPKNAGIPPTWLEYGLTLPRSEHGRPLT